MHLPCGNVACHTQNRASGDAVCCSRSRTNSPKNASMNSAEPYTTLAGVAAFLCIEDAERARLACEQGVVEQHLMNFLRALSLNTRKPKYIPKPRKLSQLSMKWASTPLNPKTPKPPNPRLSFAKPQLHTKHRRAVSLKLTRCRASALAKDKEFRNSMGLGFRGFGFRVGGC